MTTTKIQNAVGQFGPTREHFANDHYEIQNAVGLFESFLQMTTMKNPECSWPLWSKRALILISSCIALST